MPVEFINKIKKSAYLYLLIKLSVFFVIVFALDFAIGSLLGAYYYKQKSGVCFRTTYAIEKTTADILIFGSSRANHHYIPDLFEKEMNMTCYNAGRDANSIFYHYAVLRGALKRYSPKIVILDFAKNEFEKDDISYDRISSLLPYYGKHPEIKNIVELKSPFEKYKLLSKIYPVNSLITVIAVSITDFNAKRNIDFKGYIPLTRVMNEPIKTDKSFINYKLDSVKIKIYESLIKDCIKNGVKLYVVFSPYYVKSEFTDPSVSAGKEMAGRYGIKFLDYSKDTTFTNNPALFQETVHLNDNGAKIFTHSIIQQIK
jgi:hypothetical protein